ncbi:MAG: response regulator receiver protein [Betaproteobacteria bacterium]|nr:response regulator receiver protein [Betaproteobacteria bacterium]
MELTNAAEILLVEDNLRDAEMAIRALKKQKIESGILWLRDGQQALDYVESTGAFAGRAAGHPRVVLLDLKLPKVDGLKVLQRIKGSEETCIIPVVVMTSSAEHSDLMASYRLMANSYLVKPVHYDNFVESVGRAGVYWTQTNQVP